ncbi:hypothetical protein SGLAD_v1c08630 [Spiroplasma gladiatoris]|uniref:Uncharacterized protein n=1 Tax=Spiroplasma gladiatoris TaxID=2143 RepID=A0A4P7AIH6_9MOLU|nr:hypothetical protein [Spiroplasma gladiatoris]QBQ08062.1 hypothetical protein SGLAD_v1c08630 [Spiroplasma gladiatoris]
MKKIKNKKIKNKNPNKFGVFNGNVINSETFGLENEFKVEEYHDESLTITEIKTKTLKEDEELVIKENLIKKRRKINSLVYKIIASIIIFLVIIIIIVYLIIR